MDWLTESLLTQEERKVVETAEWLARERLAPRAAGVDARAEFPHADFDDLREHRLHLMRVPRAHGGLELSPLAYTLVLMALARANGSTALALNMHTGACYCVEFLGDEAQRARVFRDVVRGGLLSISGSEPTSSFTRASVFRVATVARPVADGYVVSGQKHYVSLADACQYFGTWVVLDGVEDYREAVRLALVPRDHSRLRVDRTWDTLAMRGTASQSVHMDGCVIPAADLLGRSALAFLPGGPFSSAPFELGYAAVYFGIAEGCYDWCVEFARETRYLPDPHPISHDPGVQRHVAAMSLRLEAARLAIHHACAVRGAGLEAAHRDLETHAAKYLASEAAVEVTAHAMRLMGGRSILRRYPVERFLRDAQAGVLQPPSSERILDIVGRERLGVEGRGIA
jgi:alkylation response protein AidB-like acyl-CoA dehydrogenase